MRLSDLKRYSLRTPFSEDPPGRRRDYPLLIASQSPGFVSRGATAFDIFWLGVSPVETEPGESIGSRRRMEPSTVFLIAD